MARVQTFQGGNVQRQGTTDARFRPADFGTSAVAEGLKAAGETLGKAVDKQDEIEDVKARIEANRLAVEHSEHEREIARRVKQSLGENAETAANQGIQDLDKATKDIIGRAGPRAQMLLQTELRQRSGMAADSFLDHGFKQTSLALESSTQARISSVLEDAADEDDEDKALVRLSEIRPLQERLAQHFGHGGDWLKVEETKAVSGFYKSRALKIARSMGEGGGAFAAIQYANLNRKNLSNDDYDAIVNTFDQEGMEDLAFALANDYDPAIAGVRPKPADASDPLAPLPDAVQVTPASADDTTPVEKPTVPSQLDADAFFDAFTVRHEGAAYVVDSNGAGVKYGINAEYNPGVDIKNLTQAGARQIFKKKYFERSGADKLPPALAAVHVDTFYLNERQASKILKQSGGDVDTYIQLRRSFLNGLARSNPGKFGRYQKGWENRTQALARYADQLGDGGTLPRINVQINTSVESVRDKVFNTPGTSMRFKRAYFDALVKRRNGLRQEREEVESETSRLLTTEVLRLGDGFTSLTQLPENLVTSASPSTLATLTNMAKSNVEQKPITIETAATIGFLETFSPEKLSDPKVLSQLAGMGVPPAKLRELAEQGGRAQGQIANAQPQQVDRGTLESLARPAFEAAGIFLWTTEETDKRKKPAERQMEAARQEQLLGFLGNAAREWAVNNPGKKADEATMKGWVATALRRDLTNRQAVPVGLQTDTEIVRNIGPNDRENIKRALRSNGLPVTPETIASAYRRLVIQRGR